MTAVIENFGTLDQTNIPVKCEIYEDENLVYYDEETVILLETNMSTYVSFTPIWTASPGVYDIKVTSMLASDEDNTNNQAIKTVTVIAEKDACIQSINHPTGLQRYGSYIVNVTVENSGMLDQTIPVNCSIYDTLDNLIYYSETDVFIQSFRTKYLEFTPNWEVDIEDVYTIGITTLLVGDEKPGNDYMETYVNVQPYKDAGVATINTPDSEVHGTVMINVTIDNYGDTTQEIPINCTIIEGGFEYSEDFEETNGGYTHTGSYDIWEYGTPTSGPNTAHSGENCWATVLDDNYVSSADEVLQSVPIQLPTGINAELVFWHWYDTEKYYDGGNVKISTDGGTNWEILGIYPDQYNEDVSSPNNIGIPSQPCFSGHDQKNWEEISFDLSMYQGMEIIIRWHFGSDSSIHYYPGWYIDDVVISITGEKDIGDIVYTSETSVLVPALSSISCEFPQSWTPTPGDYLVKVKTLLPGDEDNNNNMNTKIVTATTQVLCGDMNNDETVNIADLTFLLSYLFSNGPSPNPLCIGDVNADSNVNIADLTYLVAYLYNEGPAPSENCCS